MKKRKWIIQVVLHLFLLPIIGFPLFSSVNLLSQETSLKIGFIYPDHKTSKEISAAYAFLASQNFSSQKMDFEDLKDGVDACQACDVIWFHQPDSADQKSEEIDPLVFQTLHDYVKNGGSLLLTLDALHYLVQLGVENKKPQVRTVDAKDEGYGRKLGLHAFRNHPLFQGLHGGAYIYTPTEDTVCRQVGYFNDTLPQNGKIVAVDWAYIRLHEASKLVLEYDYGKGKIIAVGAYTYFYPENLNRPHLERFMNNTFNYLAGKSQGTDGSYWNYEPVSIMSFESSLGQTTFVKSKTWNKEDTKLSILSQKASDNFWDIAGQRILMMGNEKGGIEEIWAHPFMALRDFKAGLQFSESDSIHWLSDYCPELQIRPDTFTRFYKIRGVSLTEMITASIDKPAGIVHYEYRSDCPATLILKFRSNFRLMWPYSERVLRSLLTSWDKELNGFVIKDGEAKYVCILGANRIPLQNAIGQYLDFKRTGSRFHGLETDSLLVSGLLRYPLDKNDNLDIVMCASDEGLEKTHKAYKTAIVHPEKIYHKTKEYTTSFLDRCLMITTPDKDFNEGYRWAVAGTDRFFVNTPGLGKAFVAGYSTTATGWDGGHKVNGRPGYGWYFGRDAAWSGFATLDYGDFEKIKCQLQFFNSFQDVTGKIFHELTTSGALHFDAADATPLYIILAGKYLRHSGDMAFINQTWPHIQAAIDYCFSTDTDGDHLIENTNVGHGWIEGGKLYGAHTTLYLASCWAAALKEAGQMAAALGFKRRANHYQSESRTVEKIINRDFWDEKNQFFYYGKFKDGSYNPEPTVLPAIPLYFMQTDREKAIPVLNKYAENGFTSDWGVRILSEKSPLFNPKGYHYGSVWPLFTGWTALAEYKFGNATQGFTHIMNNLLVYKHWSLGYVEEVLSGAVFKPSGVCRHQCWSESMVIQPVIEGLLGIEISALENKVMITPHLPLHWDTLSVRNIRFKNRFIHFKMNRLKGKTVYSFFQSHPEPTEIQFRPIFPVGTAFHEISIDGYEIDAKPLLNETAASIDLSFVLTENKRIEVHHTKGTGVLPLVPHPKPGAPSEGFRIISTQWHEKMVAVTLQGRSDSKGVFKVYVNNNRIKSILNGELKNQEDAIVEIEVDFGSSEKAYCFETVSIFLD